MASKKRRNGVSGNPATWAAQQHEFLRIEVGTPWAGPTNGPGLAWHPETGMLVLNVVGAPLDAVERAGLSGPLDIAVLASENLVGLAVHIEGWGWQDAYTPMPPTGVPEHFLRTWGPETRQMLQFIVVVNGVTVKQRLVSMSPHASRALRDEVLARWQRLSDSAFSTQLNGIYSRYPTTHEAVMALSAARCKAGA